MSIQTIVADDDSHAVRHLRRLLEEFSQVEIVGVADNGEEALECIERLRPRLVFLDVDLPLLDAFEIYDQLIHRPAIVFVTASAYYQRRPTELALAGFFGKPVGRDDIQDLLEQLSTTD